MIADRTAYDVRRGIARKKPLSGIAVVSIIYSFELKSAFGAGSLLLMLVSFSAVAAFSG